MTDLLDLDALDRRRSPYYGKYEAVATDVADPRKIGRIRALVPAVLGDVPTGWALPCAPFGGGKERGMLFLPQVGDTVWIEFAAGDVSRPIWVGTFWGSPDSTGGADDLGTETGPEPPTTEDGASASAGLGLLKTRSGHVLVFDDDNQLVVLANGDGKTSIRFAQDGSVVIAADTIKLGKDAAEKLVLGDAFTTLFNQHTHPTGVGPSGPPAQPMTSSHVSAKVTTE